jgi:hypothetical protein
MTQKSLLRTALRPNQIEFSHGLGPLLPEAEGPRCLQLEKADATSPPIR